MTSEHWALVIMVCGGGAVACVSFLVLQALQRAQEVRALTKDEVLLTETSSGLLRMFLPMARGLGMGVRGVVTGGRKGGVYNTLHGTVQRRLFAAGTPQGLNADEYIGFGLLFALLTGLFGLFLNMLSGMEDVLGLWPMFALCGMMSALYWHSWLGKRKEQRQSAIRKSLPFALDILTLAMEAGLDFTAALARMVRKLGRTPLGQEFSLMLREIQLGKARSEALRDFARRCDVPEVRSVVASLIQAEELGASLGPVLRIMAGQQRERRSQRAEEQAMKAPVKMLFPLTVFIFPTVLIMIFTPIALKFI